MRLDRVNVALYGVIAVLLGGLVGNPDNNSIGPGAEERPLGNPLSPVAWTLLGVGALLIGFALWPRRRTQHPPEDAP